MDVRGLRPRPPSMGLLLPAPSRQGPFPAFGRCAIGNSFVENLDEEQATSSPASRELLLKEKPTGVRDGLLAREGIVENLRGSPLTQNQPSGDMPDGWLFICPVRSGRSRLHRRSRSRRGGSRRRRSCGRAWFPDAPACSASAASRRIRGRIRRRRWHPQRPR